MSEPAKTEGVKPTDNPDKIAEARACAEEALKDARDYMRAYAKFVLDRGDQGMLVDHHFTLIRRAVKTMAALSEDTNEPAIIPLPQKEHSP